MGSLKLQSFEDYANASKIAATAKLEEEQKSAREDAAYEFKTLLAEFGVTSIKDLNEEDRNKFFRKLGASEISESIAIIEEGTRSQIGKIKKNGKISTVYMHYDGYPDHMLPTIKKGYKDGKAVDLLLKKGGGSGLEANVDDIKFYGDKATIDGNMKDTEKFVKDAANNGGAEFIYLYSERDSKWYMVDIYDSYDLVPAFESMIINEAFKPSKGNARDAKKVAKALEQFFMDHPALAAPGILLGVCKYMLAESLTDANFHSYREPVSKVIKGKLATVMVKIDNLGGMSIPVGKKSIINLLDDKGAFMANAAGWSGIGIVEGMALFLDGFGHSDTAQKIVDAFELIWANESVMNEGNAFLAARAKAIEEDAEEFEFNGKKFPVIKEGVEEAEEVNEAKFKKGQYIKAKSDSDDFDGDVYDRTNDVDGSEILKNSSFEIYEIGKDEVVLWSDADQVEYSIDPDDLKNFVKESVVNEAKDPYKEIKKATKDMKGVSCDIKGDTIIVSNKAGDEFTYSMNDADDIEEFIATIEESVVNESEAENILDDLLDERGGDMGELHGMEMEDALDTVEAYGHKGSKAKKIAQELHSLCNESVVTEAKFVKEFDKGVLDAEYKADITTYYPSAKFFIGKHSHFFGELEPNLFFKAYYAKYYKEDTGNKIDGEFKITSVYSKKGSNYVNLYLEESANTVEAPKVNEAEVKSDEDFKEYAFAVLGKAFGDKFDEEKAQEVVDGLLSKHGEDYGAAVGALTASLG